MKRKKKKLLVSFSGGETSAFMAQWLKRLKSHEYDMIFVFANTGQENEETLEFVQKCDDYFELGVHWIEAVFSKDQGTRHKIVDFKTASRNGEPFEQGIIKHGIPNRNNKWCSRDLKLRAIQSFVKREVGWEIGSYYTAIGIRNDEIDRVSESRKENKIIYPLVTDQPMSKPKINFWWRNQPFRLELKGYQGNCKWCWKKSHNKLMTIAIESPEYFDFPREMEAKYGEYIPEHKKEHLAEKGVEIDLPITFFREKWSVKDIFRNSKKPFKKQHDDSDVYSWQTSILDVDLDASNGCSESCEVY